MHLQLMDHPSVLFAAGLPLRFDRFEVDGVEQHGVPSSRPPFLAPASPAGRGRG